MKGNTADNRESIYRRFSSSNDKAPENHDKVERETLPPMPEYRQIRRPREPRDEVIAEDSKHRVIVHIAGMQYRLVANDNEEEAYIREIAAKAEQLIHRVRIGSPGLPMTSLTVLALVNALDESNGQENEVVELQNKIAALSDAQKKARENYTQLREMNWELKKEVLRLQSVIDTFEKSASEEADDDHTKEMLPLEELVIDYLDREEEGEDQPT